MCTETLSPTTLYKYSLINLNNQISVEANFTTETCSLLLKSTVGAVGALVHQHLTNFPKKKKKLVHIQNKMGKNNSKLSKHSPFYSVPAVVVSWW